MGILEVHDPEGRVQRLAVSRDQPLLFGSSPKCDLILNGDRILPFQGRIRWHPGKQRFKADASPDAQFLVINGHKMSTSSLRPGDEIEVGGHRIFLLNDHQPQQDEPRDEDDRTREQAPRFAAPARPASAPSPQPRPANRPVARTTPPARPSLESRLESVVAELDRREAPGLGGAASETQITVAEPSTPVRGWSRLFYLFSKRASRPGGEEVLSSPLVAGLVGALLLLGLTGAALYSVIQRTSATRLFQRAVDDLSDGNYRDAIRRFDEFLKENPEDKRVGEARVHRAMANVRQYASATGASWTLALQAEREMFQDAGSLSEFQDTRSELDELILRTGEALADRANATADRKALAEAEDALALHQKVAGDAAEVLFKRSRFPAKLNAARASVQKSEVRLAALAAMDAALGEGSSAKVYGARDQLVERYADLAQDRELLARMTRANELIRKAVKVDPSQRPAETEPRVEPLGPITSLVLRTSPSGRAATPDRSDVPVFALTDGIAYGLDGGTGTPLWQRPVGLTSPFAPVPVPGGASALVFDVRHHELLRVESRSGRLLWRQELEVDAVDPPLVLGNQVIQPLPIGRLVWLDLETGALQGTLNLGLPISGTPVSDESGQMLYVASSTNCLFLIRRDPLSCIDVLYLGQANGSILASPARVGRFLVIPENHEVDESRLRVILLAEDGTQPKEVQTLPVRGWLWGSPVASGSVLWATGDRGGLGAYAIGAYSEKQPLRPIARLNPDPTPSGPAFLVARTEREVWVGSARTGRYDLDPERATINAAVSLGESGAAVAPPQVSGACVVFSNQNPDGPGHLLSGVEGQTGQVRWRSLLGAPWPLALRLSPSRDHLETLDLSGEPLTIDSNRLRAGGFVNAEIPRPGNFRMPGAALAVLSGTGWSAIVPSQGSPSIQVRTSAGSPHREVRLPAPVGAVPIAMGAELFLPGADGRAYLVDPIRGEPRAEPFVPPFERGRPTRWRTPTRLDADSVALADETGRLRKVKRVADPRPRLVAVAELSLGKAIVSGPVSTDQAVVVVTDENQVRALAARDLSPIGAWPLGASVAFEPSLAQETVFVGDLAGGLLAIGRDGRRLWTSQLPGGLPLTGPPARLGDDWVGLNREGKRLSLSNSTGEAAVVGDLGVVPLAPPLPIGDGLAVQVGLGSVAYWADTKGAVTSPPPVAAPTGSATP